MINRLERAACQKSTECPRGLPSPTLATFSRGCVLRVVAGRYSAMCRLACQTQFLWSPYYYTQKFASFRNENIRLKIRKDRCGFAEVAETRLLTQLFYQFTWSPCNATKTTGCSDNICKHLAAISSGSIDAQCILSGIYCIALTLIDGIQCLFLNVSGHDL